MQTAAPVTTDVVLIGGGHTHAVVLRQLGMLSLPGVQLTLITDLVDTPYSGMLPSHIAGLYDFDQAHIDLRPLTRFARCRLFQDQAVGLNLAQQQVVCANHPPVKYDLLSIDTGSTPATLAVPGAADYAIAAKPVPNLLQQWQQILEGLCDRPTRPLTLAVVGGGVGGVELTLNMQARLHQVLTRLGRPTSQVQLHLFHRGAAVATGCSRATQQRLQQILQARGVQLHLNETVVAVQPAAEQYAVHCQSDLTVGCDRVIWVTQAAAPGWLQDSGLALDEHGFIAVRDTLQSCSHDNVFAAGDVATMVDHPRPKAGVFAVRQGLPLTKNLVRYLRQQPLRPFQPQRQFLNLIDLGDGHTLAARGRLMFESTWARRWKDQIDRKFMRLFEVFPEPAAMATAASPPSAGLETGSKVASKSKSVMACAGCGSKVGRQALRQALQRVQAEFPPSVDWPHTHDVLVGLDDSDDAAVVAIPAGKVVVQTVDFFRALLEDPFIFAQICVKHCLGDLYAMGADPQTALAIAVVPYGTPAKQEETLYQLLSGVQKALGSSQIPLVGGHSSEGSDLALGFSCQGLADVDRLLRKGGLQPGNQLILTQAVGTGTLFAADMQGQAKGRWIEAAVRSMVRSNREAAQCFLAHGATACTDVTGFGLAGHLLEMLEAAQVGFQLDLYALPVLAGARETLQAGFVSSLQQQNEQAAQAIQDAQFFEHRPDYRLLFDPQTAGGLLGAVPGDRAETCLRALHQAGYPESVILGEVTPLQNQAQPIRIIRA
jgi:selenide, water dikinase